MTPIIRFIKSYHNTSVKEIKSLDDGNLLWRWDMDSSDSHIFEKLWLTFRDICRQPITLLAKIKLIQKHVIAPLTKRKIIYFEKDFFRTSILHLGLVQIKNNKRAQDILLG